MRAFWMWLWSILLALPRVDGSKRGWTLQELLAPKKAVFYDKDWALLGSKINLCPSITAATKIAADFLNGRPLCVEGPYHSGAPQAMILHRRLSSSMPAEYPQVSVLMSC
ncbi:hypothetical protein BKA67DRAFT_678255 [Truncatella angustata]|uniref:Uncharacterized protein n=1 Tax=Truncatella angustata TaxID=152316 RepID=A0A9P8ZW10_9PEZI|nr:uncharacterized protein BKA67DRAFT_678255 [Truncatella angustata]KAH6653145.1 hypothetical protein BKA67DRAFT_678255 [Truncatella angustata]